MSDDLEPFDPANPKLSPCPFCGSEADLIEIDDAKSENFGGHIVECRGCAASTSIRFSAKDDARPLVCEAWNKRVTSEIEKHNQQLIAKLHCMCGNTMSRFGCDGHTQVSMYDYEMNQMREENARLREENTRLRSPDLRMVLAHEAGQEASQAEIARLRDIGAEVVRMLHMRPDIWRLCGFAERDLVKRLCIVLNTTALEPADADP